jgi:hypothetical protein
MAASPYGAMQRTWESPAIDDPIVSRGREHGCLMRNSLLTFWDGWIRCDRKRVATGLSPKKQSRRVGTASRCDMEADPAEMVMMTATTTTPRGMLGSARLSRTWF